MSYAIITWNLRAGKPGHHIITAPDAETARDRAHQWINAHPNILNAKVEVTK